MHKLYHYVHCPFCIRIRLALGYLGLSYHSTVLPYDDEQSPVALAGKKMLPILEFPDGAIMHESLDIISHLDRENRLATNSIIHHEMPAIDDWLTRLASPVHSLAMPYWIHTPEFTPRTREYFQTKKEKTRGSFSQLVQDRTRYMDQTHELLQAMTKELTPYFKGESFTLRDVLIASHLWGLYIVPEFQFPAVVHHYLQSVSHICHFDYHADYWQG